MREPSTTRFVRARRDASRYVRQTRAFGALGALVIAVTGCWPAPSARRPQSPSSALLPAQPVEVGLDPYFRDLKTIRLTTSTDTLSMLLDTGGGYTLLTTEAAERLGCTPFGSTSGHRMSGERVEFRWCTAVPLELGGVAIGRNVTAVFDLMKLLPPELPKLDGVLSLDAFDGRVVSIDLAGNRLVVESAASADAHRASMRALAARTATGEDGSSLTIFLAARASPVPIWLLLDSGNLVGTILSPEAASRLRIADPSPVGDGTAATDSTGVEVPGAGPVVGHFVVRELIHDGALGAEFMKRGTFTFDLRSKQPWVGFLPNRM